MKNHQKFMARFAAEKIASENLTVGGFPRDLWSSMREQGFLDPLNSYSEISSTGQTLVRHGGNIGIALSWMLHQLAYQFVFHRLGTPEQRELLSGGMTACLAMSEPETGAHPKHMKTRAEKVQSGFSISGEKAYITNAPIADFFVVIAVTSEEGGRKKFSAFIVPKETPGLTVTDMSIPFLKPSPHGMVKLESCYVPESALIGASGMAYDEIVLPFREIEDTTMMGPMAGAMGFIVEGLAGNVKLESAGNDMMIDFGRMKAISDTGAIMACEAAAMLDAGKKEALLSLILVSRSLGAEFNSLASKTMTESRCRDSRLEVMISDFGAMIRIADKVAQIKQMKLGEGLLLDHSPAGKSSL